jgi:hypothetical protein
VRERHFVNSHFRFRFNSAKTAGSRAGESVEAGRVIVAERENNIPTVTG